MNPDGNIKALTAMILQFADALPGLLGYGEEQEEELASVFGARDYKKLKVCLASPIVVARLIEEGAMKDNGALSGMQEDVISFAKSLLYSDKPKAGRTKLALFLATYVANIDNLANCLRFEKKETAKA